MLVLRVFLGVDVGKRMRGVCEEMDVFVSSWETHAWCV